MTAYFAVPADARSHAGQAKPVHAPAQAGPTAPRRLLHVGCGPANKDRLPACFHTEGWREIRFDINPAVQPHIVGSITDMRMIPDGSIDAIWSSHNLEHLNAFEVPVALAEFKRVLKDDGFILVTLPDLRAVARQIVNDKLDQPLYISKAGPISALDVVFGHQASIAAGNHYMAHRTGFTASSLGQVMIDAGFAEVRVHEGSRLDLWAIATMPGTSDGVFDELASVMK
ncbi:class I SAM-dependent methyltransferase [Massilia sp. GCM10020059]|uniref:Class I SAM-dependent methyltransferase n=1 Tax=Massilia agrisoli TaxID=2892444 RepID=A0ABS8IRM0_9BURK|nr:methyltransferase domain-containing protein [Massilia agrisoli]MCC6071287.1 class I SAM-dependent methyltransferase [Massilia agrisoli]